MLPVTPLSPLIKGKKTTVLLPNGKTTQLIALNNSTSTNAIALDGYVMAGVESESVLKEIQQFKSKPAYVEEDETPNIVGVWQEFYENDTVIPLLTRRFISNGDNINPGYVVSSSGWNTLEEAAEFHANGRHVYTRGPSGTYSKVLYQDPNNLRPENERLTPENAQQLLDALADYREPGTYASETYHQGVRLTVSGSWGMLVRYTTGNPLTTGVSGNFVISGVPSGSTTYPPLSTIPAYSISDPDIPESFPATPGRAVSSISLSITLVNYITKVSPLFLESKKSVRWWLNFHGKESKPIKLLTTNYLERIRVFLTTLPDKAIFIAKIGHANGYSRPVPQTYFGGRRVLIQPREYARIMIITVAKNGSKTTEIYDYPEIVPRDPDNWQQWAYSYKDLDIHDINPYAQVDPNLYSDVEEFLTTCEYQVSGNVRRKDAAALEYYSTSYDKSRNIDYDFVGDIKYFDAYYGNPYFYFSGSPYYEPPIPLPDTAQEYFTFPDLYSNY